MPRIRSSSGLLGSAVFRFIATISVIHLVTNKFKLSSTEYVSYIRIQTYSFYIITYVLILINSRRERILLSPVCLSHMKCIYPWRQLTLPHCTRNKVNINLTLSNARKYTVSTFFKVPYILRLEKADVQVQQVRDPYHDCQERQTMVRIPTNVILMHIEKS